MLVISGKIRYMTFHIRYFEYLCRWQQIELTRTRLIIRIRMVDVLSIKNRTDLNRFDESP